ncbi:monocopper oxidase-like protein SKU5 [Populus trichocarpa]|uniref:monocopper oxidase-like protein SKU5 n=1 Tax=Populus trichocarpa TaxID=3694 RepID=UPI002279599E|nr:monocopper oxidase-like protein SKU5 [Populus trichocarpa]
MAIFGNQILQLFFVAIPILFVGIANSEEIFQEWHVTIDRTISPVSNEQPVILINGKFPGPLINATTNDMIHINVFNDMDEPVLFTWNGIQQRLNSWQDGVGGTNCPIVPGSNWTYAFQVKDQIGSFFYFPSINNQKAGGGFGPIRVNNRNVISVPFPRPEDEFDLLIGDWYPENYKNLVYMLIDNFTIPLWILMNGKGPYLNTSTKVYESFTVAQGKTYRFRISNVGNQWSFNFRIQNHHMLVVETEGSYTNQIMVDSLDVHVGQSYSVLVTADQKAADYYIVATPKMVNTTKYGNLVGVGVLHYLNSSTMATGPLPSGPDPYDLQFSINQAKSIKWNMTTGAARPNPQGTFNVTNVTLSQTFILTGSRARDTQGFPYYTVNDVWYTETDTPLKLADLMTNGSGVYELDKFSTNSSNGNLRHGVFVASGNHKGWLEIVLKNDLDVIDSWHLDGYGFYVVGFGDGNWTLESRNNYNLYDPVVRSTIQVYPKRWTAVYAYLDNPGMWNLRSQSLKNWYLGQQLYLRVYDADPNPAKERPPPDNLLLCGAFGPLAPPPPPLPPPPSPPAPANPSPSQASSTQITCNSSSQPEVEGDRNETPACGSVIREFSDFARRILGKP